MPEPVVPGFSVAGVHPSTAVVAFRDVLTFEPHCNDCERRLRIVHINMDDELVVFTRDELLLKALRSGDTLIDDSEDS